MPKRPTSRAAIVLKLLVDQLVFAPISTILLFIALETMKGTPEQIPLIIQVRCCGSAERRCMLNGWYVTGSSMHYRCDLFAQVDRYMYHRN